MSDPFTDLPLLGRAALAHVVNATLPRRRPRWHKALAGLMEFGAGLLLGVVLGAWLVAL